MNVKMDTEICHHLMIPDVANFNLQREMISRDYVHLQEFVTDDANHSVLLRVVHWNPRAARCADADRRLPLTLALMSNKTWDDGLQHLIWAAPQAFGDGDPVTRMFIPSNWLHSMWTISIPYIDWCAVFHKI
jgi:hypothetical protein